MAAKKKTPAKKLTKSSMKKTKGGILNYAAVAFHFDKRDAGLSGILQQGGGAG